MVQPPPSPQLFEDLSLEPPVRGTLHPPAGLARDGLVLSHGAGGNRDAPLLSSLAVLFAARGLTVLRCDLPYRQTRPRGSPHPRGAAVDRQGLKHAALSVRHMVPGRVFLGGLSYGGRQSSMLLATEPHLADALLLLSYPLHPPQRPADLRTAHLAGIHVPTLFVHGSTDPFGSVAEMTAACALIPGASALVIIDGAGHDLHHGRPGTRRSGVAEKIVIDFLAFVG